MESMKIEIIGRGNVATHLMNALHSCADVKAVNPRSLEGLRLDADLYLIAVSDNAISEVSGKLGTLLTGAAVVAHTSGTTPLSTIGQYHRHAGVFYPLQTFSKGVELDYSEIPFFIEATDPASEQMLFDTARQISHEVHHADSEKRRHLHLGSVVACNFANHLWTLSSEYLEKHDIDFRLLLPLLEETTRKLRDMPPAKAQTGPAARHDTATISRHMEMLAADSKLREIYRIMSESIMNHRTE